MKMTKMKLFPKYSYYYTEPDDEPFPIPNWLENQNDARKKIYRDVMETYPDPECHPNSHIDEWRFYVELDDYLLKFLDNNSLTFSETYTANLLRESVYVMLSNKNQNPFLRNIQGELQYMMDKFDEKISEYELEEKKQKIDEIPEESLEKLNSIPVEDIENYLENEGYLWKLKK